MKCPDLKVKRREKSAYDERRGPAIRRSPRNDLGERVPVVGSEGNIFRNTDILNQ